MNANQLRTFVIRPVLEHLDLWSQAAENLILGTAAQESGCGEYLAQLGGGPALGIYQMEPATHDDILQNFVRFKPALAARLAELKANYPIEEDQLVSNLAYATAMCRLHYLRVKEPLPDADNVDNMARYWKKYYNTELGKGKVEEFIRNYMGTET